MLAANDPHDLVQQLRKAADQGDAEAQHALGGCYRGGNGVEQDYREAARWYRKAADQGLSQAQYELGLCYRDGDGVTKDLDDAAMWFCEAACQGHMQAQHELGLCYRHGQGVDMDLDEAARWFQKAAEKGHAEAQHMLGTCSEYGGGVEENQAEAQSWPATSGLRPPQTTCHTMFLPDHRETFERIQREGEREFRRMLAEHERTQRGGEGCFIATAAYGSTMACEVRVLRWFRDEYLLKSRVGRSFTRLYYRLSPGMATIISNHPILKSTVRFLLIPMVWMVTQFQNDTK